jgi:aminoglycoside 3-N-acetyltransferase I
MGDFAVLRLTARHVGRLRAALALYADAFGEPESYLAHQPDDAYVKRLLGDRSFIQLVAEEDGQVVGALSAYVLAKFEQARSEIYIYDLAVSADRRRRGIATALIRALDPIAADEGAWAIYVQADRGDVPAIALYDSLGEREDVFHFDLHVISAQKPGP